MRPRDPVSDELAQERRREHGTTPRLRVVLAEVGDLGAADLLLHLLGDRHRPHLLPGTLCDPRQLALQVLVVAEDA
jgi:hypothetical protein